MVFPALLFLCLLWRCTWSFSLGTLKTTAWSRSLRPILADAPTTLLASTSSSSISTRDTFRYEITSSFLVPDNEDHNNNNNTGESSCLLRLLPLVVQGFGLPSASQARKALRWGEIVVLPSCYSGHHHHDHPPLVDHVPTMDVRSFTPDHDDDDVLGNRTVVYVADPLTKVQPGDLVARIARIDNPNLCYPQFVTGFVQPPPPFCLDQEKNDNTSGDGDSLCVLYQDDDLAVVDKPPGWVTIGVPRQDLQSVLPFVLAPPPSSLLRQDVYYYWPRPVHRLDRATRGLVVVAKTAAAMTALSRAFADRQVHKTYTAVVFGNVTTGSNHDGDGTTTITHPVDDKAAVSEWQVVQRHASGNYTMLQVWPRTGRFHQIRRHLAYGLQCPIVGETKYDFGRYKAFRGQGLYLAATKIALVHPVTQEPLEVSIPVPEHFTQLLSTKHGDPFPTWQQPPPQNDVENHNFAIHTPSSPTTTTTTTSQGLSAWVEQVRQELGETFDTDDGVACTGEPAIDPSRMINANQGDSEWMDDW